MTENLRKFLSFNVAYAPADDNGSDDLGILELDENLDETEKPEELQAGVYEAEIQDVQVQTSSKGNQYYAVRFVVPPENIPNDLREGFPDGASLYWNRQVVPKKGDRRALWNLRRFIEALGLPSNTNTIDPNEWMGQRARIRVRMGKWEGQERAEIQAVESAEPEARAPRREATTAAPARGGAKKSAARGRGR